MIDSPKDKLKFSRMKEGFTQKKVAELWSVHPQTITKYELGRNESNLEMLDKMATLYNAELEKVRKELQRETAERKDAENALEERIRFETILADISTRFVKVSLDKIDAEINRTLKILGEFMDVDYCYVTVFSDDHLRFSCSHEWCAPEIPSTIDKIQDISTESFKWYFNEILSGEAVILPSLNSIPKRETNIREFFTAMDIKSAVAVPLLVSGSICGKIGFDSVQSEKQWSEEIVSRLRLVGEIIGTAITRKKVVEETEKQRQELAKADKMISLGTLVSGVAHEINNPSQFILTNAPILKDLWKEIRPILDRHYDENPSFRVANLPYSEMREEAPAMIEEILNGADRIKLIVSELRNYTRGRSSHSKGPVAVNEAVKSTLTLLANSIKKATHQFFVTYDQDIPTIQGNIHRLEQVLINLIMNACQSLPDQKKYVKVETKLDSVNGNALITIKDQGCGINKSDLTHICDPFFTTKRTIGGTGLGLAVAAKIVEEHDGKLKFKSEVGKGTVAKIILPITY